MKRRTLFVASLAVSLAGCALTPEQKAAREAKRVRAEQALQVQLAKQCDSDTAELIHQQFNPPLSQTEQERTAFEQRYAEKVNNPMFQACYKLALQNYKAQQEIEFLQRHYDDDFRFGFGFSRFCYACW